MQSIRVRSVVMGVALGSVLVLGACNTNKPADETVTKAETDGVTTTARVEAIDSATRDVTLRWEDGVVTTYKCGPEVRNFAQIRVGDTVHAMVADSVAVSVGPSQGEPVAGTVTDVSRTRLGEKPGMVVTSTALLTARVLAVDSVFRTVTVRGPAGKERVIRVKPDVNLGNVTVGNDVTLTVTETVAIWVTGS